MPDTSLQLTMKVVDLFVDRPAVRQAVEKARKKNLIRWGALTRKIARNSLRRRKKSAQPGNPPHTHSPAPNLKTIYYAFDTQTKTVVVGPVLLGSNAGSPLPEKIQKGGVVIQRVGTRRKPKLRRTRMRAFPFMGPAMEKSADTAPDLFRDSIGP